MLQKHMFGPLHAVALKACNPEVPPSEVLDVGCGTGNLLALVAERWDAGRLTGVDLSLPMIAEARRKYDRDARFTFKQGDASELPFTSDSFDAVFSTISFHHWGDQALGIREVARVLRKGGHFVLVDQYMPALLRPLLGWLDHATFRGPSAIQDLLEQGGFAIVLRQRTRSPRAQMFVAQKC